MLKWNLHEEECKIAFNWLWMTFIGTHMVMNVRFEILTAVTMKSIIFWGVIPCILIEVELCFERAYYFRLQGRNVGQVWKDVIQL
jgi:hypothetical protein